MLNNCDYTLQYISIQIPLPTKVTHSERLKPF
jgi:hypothetical protein